MWVLKIGTICRFRLFFERLCHAVTKKSNIFLSQSNSTSTHRYHLADFLVCFELERRALPDKERWYLAMATWSMAIIFSFSVG